jgi:lipopolysaccharide transport system permease protein
MSDRSNTDGIYTWSPDRRTRSRGGVVGSRHILFSSVVKDLKVRYKQTTLGILWVVLQPLLTMVVFYNVIFGSGRIGFPLAEGSQGVPLYIGLTIWNMCLQSISTGSIALMANQAILTKIYFPRQIPVLATSLTALVDFSVGIALLPIIALVTHTPMHYAGFALALALMIPLVLVLHVFSLLLAAVIVRFRDVKLLVPFILTLLFFLSTVFIPPGSYPSKYRSIVLANPIAIVIDTFRHLTLGAPSAITGRTLAISAVVCVVMALLAALSFSRAERLFSDIY